MEWCFSSPSSVLLFSCVLLFSNEEGEASFYRWRWEEVPWNISLIPLIKVPNRRLRYIAPEPNPVNRLWHVGKWQPTRDGAGWACWGCGHTMGAMAPLLGLITPIFGG